MRTYQVYRVWFKTGQSIDLWAFSKKDARNQLSKLEIRLVHEIDRIERPKD